MLVKKTLDKFINFGNNTFFQLTDRITFDWIKLAIILLVLVASIGLGLVANPEITIATFVLVGGVIGLVILLRRPEIGIVLLIPISFFAPWELSTGTNVSLNLTLILSIVIIGIWIFKVITSHMPSHPLDNSINILSLIFLIVTVISLIGGGIQWVSKAQAQASLFAQVGGWLLYVLPIGIMLYVQAHFKDIRWLKITVWLFIILGAIYIFRLFTQFEFLTRLSIFAPRSVEAMFWTWLAALTFGQFLFNNELNITYKFALGVLTLAIIASGISGERREWSSGWLPPLLAIGTILALRSWRVGLATGLVGIAIFGLLRSGILSDFLLSPNQYSITSRSATYPIMLELIKANPIIGLGFANYSHYTYLYPILGWYVSFNSHNNYIDLIAQTGVVGLLVFLWLVAAIGLRGWKLSNIRNINLDGFSKGYIYACIGGLVGMMASGMLGDWFLPYLYNIGVSGFRSSVFAWIFIGGLLALGRIIDKRMKENSSSATSLPQ